MRKTALFLLISSIVFSQNQMMELSLDQAVAYGLQNNRQAKEATIDVEIARQTKNYTLSTGLPQIDVESNYNQWLNQLVTLVPSEYFGGPSGQYTPLTFGATQTFNATISLRQKIFDGSYLVAIQASKTYQNISKKAKIKTNQEVEKTILQAYLNVLLNDALILLIEDNLKTLNQDYEKAMLVYENGLIEQEILEQLQLTLAELESNLKYTLKTKSMAYEMLKVITGISMDQEIKITDSIEKLTLQRLKTVAFAEKAAVENTIEYLIAKNDLKSKSLLVKLERSKALPVLSAFVNTGYNANAESFRFFEKDQKWFQTSIFGVGVKFPLFTSFGRKANIKKALLEKEKSKNKLIELKKNKKLAINQAWNDYNFALENHNIKQKTLALAQRIEHKNQVKFFEGLASSFDFNQAKRQLYDAQVQHIESMINVVKTHKMLEIETIQITEN